MQPTDCYRILGLARNASWEDIKISYRRLARKYHPDVNQGDPSAVDKFRRVQEAYQMLRSIEAGEKPTISSPSPTPTPPQPPPKPPSTVQVKVEVRPPQKSSPPLSAEAKLRLDTIKRVQELLRQRKYAVAIAMVEGMRERFPDAPEVVHWQAVAYQRYGNEMILLKKLREAEGYLQKALRTDPNNRELCFEVRHDLERLDRMR